MSNPPDATIFPSNATAYIWLKCPRNTCKHLPVSISQSLIHRSARSKQGKWVDATYSASAVVAPANDSIAAHVKRAHTPCMPGEDAQHSPSLHIPYTQGAVARATHRDGSVV